ncbi:lactoylglutathione lyase [Bacillus sp. OV322]|uniref:VOC family protein n=1 Tax=Bacillus sp. OV322 TaxID=1882764 RepID=UPI0008E2E00E|nr:VOC family protein [Bacillus sp. OV322]SFC17537.1 lactoylglutathione lyase [Bacillus sp. OV322]
MYLHHIAIGVTDIEASIDFYQRILGFTFSRTVQFRGSDIPFLELNGCTLDLILVKEVPKDLGEHHFCFEVPYLKETIRRLLAEDIPLLEGPFQLENLQTVFFQGPSGEVIEFLQRA